MQFIANRAVRHEVVDDHTLFMRGLVALLALIAFGDSNKLIAHKLAIAETTVKIHVQHILRKLHLSSCVQGAVYVISWGGG